MKKILITGAGSGLGRALALCYAQAGCEICVADVDQNGGDETVRLVTQAGGSAFYFQCDITQQSDVDKLTVALQQRWTCLDMLINNAGVATAGKLEYESIEQWQWVLNINVLGQVRVTQAMLPLLRLSERDDRDIVNIASQAGITAGPGMGSYCVSKAAMVSLSETAYLELKPEGIHVSVVCPAFFDTNLNKSLRSEDKGMQNVVDSKIKNSGVTADSIAEKVLAGVQDRKFMILTHQRGIDAYEMKRALPIEQYLSETLKSMTKFLHTAK